MIFIGLVAGGGRRRRRSEARGRSAVATRAASSRCAVSRSRRISRLSVCRLTIGCIAVLFHLVADNSTGKCTETAANEGALCAVVVSTDSSTGEAAKVVEARIGKRLKNAAACYAKLASLVQKLSPPKK